LKNIKTVDEVKINNQDLKNVNGGAIYEFRQKYYCNDCGAQFDKKINGACPYCHGTNVVLRD